MAAMVVSAAVTVAEEVPPLSPANNHIVLGTSTRASGEPCGLTKRTKRRATNSCLSRLSRGGTQRN